MEPLPRHGWSRYVSLMMFSVAVCGAVFAARVVAADLQSCSVTAESAAIDPEESEMIRLVNEHRVANGKRALVMSETLSRAAAWMANDMAVKGYFGHTDSLGRDPFKRTMDCGYPVPAGENLAAGTERGTGARAFDILLKSPPHDDNMLEGMYFQIGVARVYSPDSQYKWYWAQTFGTIDGRPPTPTPPPVPTVAKPPPALPSSPPAAPLLNEQAKLPPGSNLVTWTSASAALGEALELVKGEVEMIYRYDEASNRWQRFGPSLPVYLNTLGSLDEGRAYWLISRGSLELPPGP